MDKYYISYIVWDATTYPFPNFNGVAVEVKGWISYFFPHLTGHVITYRCWDLSQTMLVVVKKATNPSLNHNTLMQRWTKSPHYILNMNMMPVNHVDELK